MASSIKNHWTSFAPCRMRRWPTRLFGHLCKQVPVSHCGVPLGPRVHQQTNTHTLLTFQGTSEEILFQHLRSLPDELIGVSLSLRQMLPLAVSPYLLAPTPKALSAPNTQTEQTHMIQNASPFYAGYRSAHGARRSGSCTSCEQAVVPAHAPSKQYYFYCCCLHASSQ